jgi:hypothetical protein
VIWHSDIAEIAMRQRAKPMTETRQGKLCVCGGVTVYIIDRGAN